MLSEVFRRPARAGLLAALVLLAGCSIAKPRNDDPWEKWNRKAFAFNQAVDKAVIRPVAAAPFMRTEPAARPPRESMRPPRRPCSRRSSGPSRR